MHSSLYLFTWSIHSCHFVSKPPNGAAESVPTFFNRRVLPVLRCIPSICKAIILFDYLKKTGSSLVLLRIVEEEVVAKFGRALKKTLKRGSGGMERIQAVAFSGATTRIR